MMRAYNKIVTWIGSLKGRLYGGFVLSIFTAMATALPTFISAWIRGQLIDSARNGTRIDGNLAWVCLAAIAGCVAVRFVLSYAKARIQESIGYERAAETRQEVGDILKRLPLGYYQHTSTGDILSTVTTNLNTLELEGVRQVDAALGSYIAAGVITAWLFVVSPLCGIVALVAIGVAILTLVGVNKMSARRSPAAKTATERLSGATVALYNGLGTAKSYGTSQAVRRPFDKAVEELRRARIDIEFGYTPLNVSHKLILEIASVILVLVATAGLVSGSLELWVYLGIAFFSTTVFSGIGRLTDSAHMFADLNDCLERVEALASATPIDRDGKDIRLDRYDIEFDDVSFSYGDGNGCERQVIHGVSFSVPEGSTCAIVGPSGSGKTTLTSLMARFYDVSSGAVRIGGRDVRELTCDSLLCNFSMVFQDVYLFNDTIAANIAFGAEGATRGEVVEAAKRARCHDFISALPNGYDTVVGKGGNTLSGGERQRISIARALLKDAPIVVLDEATASIDPENERQIQHALDELTRNKTVVVIAHRLATIENADQILVVDDGRIVQRGTHAKLAAEPGVYQRFVAIRKEAEGWKI